MIADIANNINFLKFKDQFLLLSKKALICVSPLPILLVAKSIKEDFFVKYAPLKYWWLITLLVSSLL